MDTTASPSSLAIAPRTPGKWRLPRTLKLGVIAAVALFAIYTIGGFFVIPYVAKSYATSWVKDNLGKTLTIGKIRFNPFNFATDINDLAIGDANGKMVGFAHLRLNYDVLSNFTGHWRWNEILLDQPYVNAVIDPAKKLNLLELIPEFESDKPMHPLHVDHLAVTGGQISFEDHSIAGRPRKLFRPITFDLRDFETDTAEGGNFTLRGHTQNAEDFHFTGMMSLAPIASRGDVVVSNLLAQTIRNFMGEYLPYRLDNGQMTVALKYDFAYRDGVSRLKASMPRIDITDLALTGGPDAMPAALKVAKISANVSDFALANDGRNAPSMTGKLAAFAMNGIDLALRQGDTPGITRLESVSLADSAFDYGAKSVSLGTLTLDKLSLKARRNKAGEIDLMTLMPTAAPTPAPSPAAEAPTEPPAPWAFSLDQFVLKDATFFFEDDAAFSPARFELTPVNFTAQGLKSDMTQPVRLSFDMRVNRHIAFSGSGQVTPTPGDAQVQLSLTGLQLKDMLPYMARRDEVDLRSGTINAAGTVKLRNADPQTAQFSGRADLLDVAVHERSNDTPLVAWDRFSLSGIDATATRTTIASGRLVGPRGQVAILPTGSYNFSAAMDAEAAAMAQAAPPGGAAAVPAMLMRMNRLDIEGGQMGFSDYSIDPNFRADIDALSGTISNISNAPDTISTIDLKGQVIDRFSPATFHGTMNLFGYDRRTDMQVSFKNIELPVFNPYSGRYAGYAIAKGKLSADFDYKINNRALDAKHKIILDQLEWGEATESKDKVPLPIRFATSLLKDRHGVIDLDLPVTGSLDDPQFSYGPLVWKMIGNLFEKIITAPFRLLGSLFGGSDKAQFIDFDPGSATLSAETNEALTSLGKALVEKQEIKLEIPAGPGIREDATAIAEQRYLAALMAREAEKGQSTDPLSLKTDERYDRLRKIYKAKLGGSPDLDQVKSDALTAAEAADEGKVDKGEVQKLAAIDYMHEKLIPAFMPSDAELAQLGTTRATAVRDALLANAEVPPERLFMTTKEMASAVDGHARIELKLER